MNFARCARRKPIIFFLPGRGRTVFLFVLGSRKTFPVLERVRPEKTNGILKLNLTDTGHPNVEVILVGLKSDEEKAVFLEEWGINVD